MVNKWRFRNIVFKNLLRFKLIIPFLFLTITFSCSVTKNAEVYFGNWKEKSLPFSESITFQNSNDLLAIILNEKFCCSTEKKYQWLRNPINLSSTFEVMKRVGLQRLISQEKYMTPIPDDLYWGDDWLGISANTIVHKMMDSYHSKSETEIYYQKFWSRRRAEGDAKVVFRILEEVDAIYWRQLNSVLADSVDTLLYQLVSRNVELNDSDSLTRAQLTQNYFLYLHNTDLDYSAYNLIINDSKYKNRGLNTDSLASLLNYSIVSEERYLDDFQEAEWVKMPFVTGP